MLTKGEPDEADRLQRAQQPQRDRAFWRAWVRKYILRGGIDPELERLLERRCG